LHVALWLRPGLDLRPGFLDQDALKATEQPVDTGIAVGKAFVDMLGVFAEFETNPRRERQLEGATAANARGVYKACKPSIEGLHGFREAEANSVIQHRPSKLSGGSRMRISVRPKRGAPRNTRADIVLGAVNSAVTL
jgi:DNA invertase Pin-like site-specific DNA recombinase